MNKNQFSELNIRPQLTRALEEMGFDTMTPIQSQTFEPIMDQRDIVALAPTGTGKTCAFGLPIMEMTDAKERQLSTIVLCPTRELAKQITDVLHQLLKFIQGIKVLSIYGGENINRQIQKLKARPQIVVATPGRLMDHIKRRTIKMEHIQRVVLDEADRMLDMGFRQDIDKILSSVPSPRQMILFSATMSSEIRQITKRFLNDPVNIQIAAESRAVDTVKQYSSEVLQQKKTKALIRLLNEKSFDSSLIFVRTKSKARQLSRTLSQKGFNATALHGDLDQRQRDKVMRKYKNGLVSILVATDVASRGLDVDNIKAVVNYDLPEDSDCYVHRIGRTGRGSQTGDAYTLFDPSERRKMKHIIRETNTQVEAIQLQDPGDTEAFERILKEKSASFSRQSRRRSGNGRKKRS